MKAGVWIGACALLLAGNVVIANVAISIQRGGVLNTRIETIPFSELEITCFLDPPTGDTITFTRDAENTLFQAYDHDKFTFHPFDPLTGCAVDVKITDSKDEGVWRLRYETTAGAFGSATYEVSLKEDKPATEPPAEDKSRVIEYLNGLIFQTAVGNTHEVRINVFDFVNTESCHILTPNEIEYNLDEENSINSLGVKAIKNANTACGIELTVQSEDSVGRWILISRDTRHSIRIERRLNITINVEENVRAMPAEVTITEGSDLYVRLEEPSPLIDNCKLTGPNGRMDTPHKIDESHKNACGFVVPDVHANYTGSWEITYGNKIIYRAVINVNVTGPWEGAVIKQEWVKDAPVDVEVGPEGAVYCSIAAPERLVVFESFGRCRISLARVTDEHSGTWSMVVGIPGRVLTEQHTITVHVKSAAPRPQVITRVEVPQHAMLLTCAITGENPIKSCKFRDPSGRVLMASQGVGEDRYSFHGIGVTLESNTTPSDCGLRITNPVAEDVGIWRCSVVTSDDQVHHGFLKASWPWANVNLDDSTTKEPTLTPLNNQVLAVEGDAVTMSCSIQSEIRYCYFRAFNGTIFSIAPSTQSDALEYVGAGFDAGECGIRFSNLLHRDSGSWSCHVGFKSLAEEEQRATFSVDIQRAITAVKRQFPKGLIIEGQVHDQRALEYCRYVRIDGLGFTSQTLPDRYTSHDDLSKGLCSIHVEHPTILDMHPWTVVAKVIGQEVEVQDSTDNNLEPPGPPPPPPQIIFIRRSHAWIIFLLLGISLMMMSLSMSTKTSRQWVRTRAVTIRNSFRKPPPMQPVNTNNTAMAA